MQERTAVVLFATVYRFFVPHFVLGHVDAATVKSCDANGLNSLASLLRASSYTHSRASVEVYLEGLSRGPDSRCASPHSIRLNREGDRTTFSKLGRVLEQVRTVLLRGTSTLLAFPHAPLDGERYLPAHTFC